jgi:hypothetical protein
MPLWLAAIGYLIWMCFALLYWAALVCLALLVVAARLAARGWQSMT